MLPQKVESVLIAQVHKEVFSSNLYLAMASWAESEGLEGISKWLYIQSDEERQHMLKLVHYINDRGGRAILPAVEQPPVSFTNVKTLFQQVLEHEEFITNAINEIVLICANEKDFTTHNWIQWFVNEQIQEEKSARTILDKLKILGDNNLYQFDRDILSLRINESASDQIT